MIELGYYGFTAEDFVAKDVPAADVALIPFHAIVYTPTGLVLETSCKWTKIEDTIQKLAFTPEPIREGIKPRLTPGDTTVGYVEMLGEQLPITYQLEFILPSWIVIKDGFIFGVAARFKE